jgi:hypothetical protein
MPDPGVRASFSLKFGPQSVAGELTRGGAESVLKRSMFCSLPSRPPAGALSVMCVQFSARSCPMSALGLGRVKTL